ncbi:unnamed protein product [Clavelina lepadiformis]|uniref:Ubiquinol-cytochrome c chaperone domain-containing protein n=1 Tax=Clavelina lepadiformis TaxID=159417 RepID=A0ABP0GQC3_CLALP
MSHILRHILLVRSLSTVHVVQKLIPSQPNFKSIFQSQVLCQNVCYKCRLLSLQSRSPYQKENSLEFDKPGSGRLLKTQETVRKGLHKLGIILPQNYTKQQLNNSAYVLLNGIYMKVKHAELREHAGLEDSFRCWLNVVYIHLWFLCCRFKQEGRDGEIIITLMMKMLWQDVEDRLEKFEEELKENLSKRKKMKECYTMLHLFFIFLDEGILGSDAMLASSLWNRIYMDNYYQPEIWHLEFLVHYVRFTATWLQDTPMDTLVLQPEAVEWTLPT